MAEVRKKKNWVCILAREATPGKNRENFEYFDWVYEELHDKAGICDFLSRKSHIRQRHQAVPSQ